MSKGLNEIRDEALDTAVKNGFTEATFVEALALIHSEVSEALEEYRSGYNVAAFYYQDSEGKYRPGTVYTPSERVGWKPVGIPSELADIIIRVAHLAGAHKIDLERAVEEKLAYNKTRSFRHGGKVI